MRIVCGSPVRRPHCTKLRTTNTLYSNAVAKPELHSSLDGEAASSANSYAILAKLATGGMAELFLARTASTAGVERYVVLKRVLPDRLKDTNFVAMFLDEARLAAQLQHPNIAQVFDTGKLGDSYFFSMEYVHGETVREIIHRAQVSEIPVPIGCALTIIANAAAGLHHAHERLGLDGKPLGIVHRDVSPSNLMVSYEGNVKVVDFGVAKTSLRTAETQAGTVKGKIGYLSPEQCRGRAADRRSDLFSLGIVLWELLVGERMYKRENDYDTMEAIVLDKTIPPSTLRAEVPPELDAIVMKLLAKAPGDRYQTADELHEDIEAVADSTAFRISTAALKRFVLELFGKRPEPWIEHQVRDARPEIVTVSAAVVGHLDTVMTSIMDSQLYSLPDLTNTPSAPRRTPTPLAFAAVDDEPDGVASPFIGIRPTNASKKKPNSQTTLKVRGDEREPSRWPVAVATIVVLGVLGVGGWFVFLRHKPAPAFGTNPGGSASDGSDTQVAMSGSNVAGSGTPTTTGSGTTASKASGSGTTGSDTSTNVDAPGSGSAKATGSDTEANTKPPKGRDSKQSNSKHPPRPVEELAANMRAGKFSDVVVSCLVNAKVLAQNVASCTLAACEVHDSANARAWFANLAASKRDSILAQCAVAGVMLEPKKATCETDPSLCHDTKVVKPKCDPNDLMDCRK